MSSRSAEWYFLMGSVNYRRGWLDEARGTSRQPHHRPQNQEYQQALFRMSGGTGPYRTGGYGGGKDMNRPATACSSLICADSLRVRGRISFPAVEDESEETCAALADDGGLFRTAISRA